MGATAVRHAQQVLTHVETIVAIELLAAAQGIDFRRRSMGGAALQGAPLQGAGTAVAYNLIRRDVPFLADDVVLAPYIESVRQLVASGELKRAVEEVVGAR